MKFVEGVNINSFLNTAKRCSGDVYLQTTEGDILNLKSLLSRYVLMTIMGKPDLLKNAQITCVQEEDYRMLSDYLELSEES